MSNWMLFLSLAAGAVLLAAAVGALDADAAEPLVDAVCTNIIALLHEQGLSELDDGYLERQAYAVTGGIADTAIRNLPVLMG